MEKKSMKSTSVSDPSPPEIFPIEEEEEEEDFEFEFAFSTESDRVSFIDSPADGDDIFCNGQILAQYPLFNRNLIPMDELNTLSSSNSSSSSDSTKDLQRLSTSAPDLFPKSSSTGSSAPRKWKLRDLVVGRSRSDGKERFLVIGFPDQKDQQKKKEEKKGFKTFNSFANKSASSSLDVDKKEKKGKGEMDIVTAHRIYYGKNGAAAAPATPAMAHRRSFLPYRQELLGGIFGNAKHHHHPF